MKCFIHVGTETDIETIKRSSKGGINPYTLYSTMHPLTRLIVIIIIITTVCNYYYSVFFSLKEIRYTCGMYYTKEKINQWLTMIVVVKDLKVLTEVHIDTIL